MSAFAELQAEGNLGGPETLTMLRRVAHRVVRSRSFPPPEGFENWNAEAIDYLLSEVFATKGRRAKSLLVDLYTLAVDDSTLEARTFIAIENVLKDRAKATVVGRLRRRLNTLLGNDDRFARPQDKASANSWALAGGPDHPWFGEIEELDEVARNVRGVRVDTLPSAGPTPLASRVALLAVCHRVIEFAQSAVREQVLARVTANRFDLVESPLTVELPSPGPVGADRWSEPAHDKAGESHDTSESSASIAKALWAGFSAEERRLFPVLDCSAAERRAATGLGPRTTEALAENLAEKVRLATVDSGAERAVVRALLAIVDQAGRDTSSLESMGDPGLTAEAQL